VKKTGGDGMDGHELKIQAVATSSIAAPVCIEDLKINFNFFQGYLMNSGGPPVNYNSLGYMRFKLTRSEIRNPDNGMIAGHSRT
jgi:hypothetical protein